jgi:hypothetical protein
MYLWSEFRIRVDLRYECTQPRPKKEKHITDSSMHWTGKNHHMGLLYNLTLKQNNENICTYGKY